MKVEKGGNTKNSTSSGFESNRVLQWIYDRLETESFFTCKKKRKKHNNN